MTGRAARMLGAAATAVAVVVSSPPAGAQPAAGAIHLLDVPYLPQSEALCGGAAAAMVMRYWGAAGVYAETFGDLVDRTAGGIRGEDLLQALHARGWQARSFRGDSALVQSHLAARQPIVALIQDRPGSFHYVVIVGWAGGRVILHDPARAPFRVLDERAFSDAWSQSGYWTMVATPSNAASSIAGPPPDSSLVPPADHEGVRPAEPCGPMVAEGVRLADAGDTDGATRLLEVATGSCPSAPGPWRELAGLHALRKEWREAAGDARRALARDGADQLAWRILATASYLEGDPDAALDAWNRVGEPVIDLVKVTGLGRTRYMVAAGALGLEPRTLLTRRALDAARRRIAELPAAQTTRVLYRPMENGRAEIEAIVLERPLVPASPVAFAAMGLRALTNREVTLDVANPSGGGETWSVAWRWWENRPRLGGAFAAPASFGGLWRVDAFDDRQSYALSGGRIQEVRRRAAFTASGWTQLGIKWQAEAGVDSWRGTSRSVSLGVRGEQRFAGDRAAITAGAAAWRGGVRTWTAGLASDWRSRVRHEGQVWTARGGIDLAGERAPLALWPGAGTGQGRDVLLRAHPLLHDGTIGGGVFGRTLAHGGVEWRYWTRPRGKFLRVAPAVFVDAARAEHTRAGAHTLWRVDAGAGLRVAVPGAGVVRVDVGRGLRDDATALSVGWTK